MIGNTLNKTKTAEVLRQGEKDGQFTYFYIKAVPELVLKAIVLKISFHGSIHLLFVRNLSEIFILIVIL